MRQHSELPERIEQTVFAELEGAERRRYEELLAHYRDQIHRQVSQVGLSRATPTILEGLLRLRQAACHPGLLDRRRADQSSVKLERLLDELEPIAESGQKGRWAARCSFSENRATTDVGAFSTWAGMYEQYVPYELYANMPRHDPRWFVR